MRFDWKAFCDRYSIRYVTTGPNVARNRINIKCPFCGHNDPSEHMGLDLGSSRWACWRDASHRGSKPHRLIKKLLHCSQMEAEVIVGDATLTPDTDTDTLRDRLNADVEQKPEVKIESVDWFDHFRDMSPTGGGRDYWRYMKRRGFDDIEWLSELYDLRYCITGRFARRVLLPIHHRETMVGWVARAVGPSNKRYLAYPPGDGRKVGLFNGDVVGDDDRVLVVVEGSLDALKLDWYGQDHGLRSVAVLSTSATDSQINLIGEMAQGFKSLWVMGDSAANSQALDLANRLSPWGAVWRQTPNNRDDPGEMTGDEVVDLARSA